MGDLAGNNPVTKRSLPTTLKGQRLTMFYKKLGLELAMNQNDVAAVKVPGIFLSDIEKTMALRSSSRVKGRNAEFFQTFTSLAQTADAGRRQSGGELGVVVP